jgi:hypothetical protein
VGDPGAADALDEAIDAYARGFNADPRDFYPGVNLVTLLACRQTPEDLSHIEELLPVVSFAVGRKGGLRTKDYWVLATVLEVAAIAGDESRGRRALSAMLDTEPAEWMRDTTVDNLQLIVADVAPALERPTEWVVEVVNRLRTED